MVAKAHSPGSLWLAYLAKGGSMRELRGLDKSQLEAMYKVAHGRFSSALYEDALLIFRHLCLLDHSNYSYFLGLGATQSEMHLYAQAAATFAHAEKLDIDDPRASLAMGGCFIELKRMSLARQALNNAIKRAERSQNSSVPRWEQELKKAQQLMKYASAGRI